MPLTEVLSPLYLRFRLLRRISYRAWKSSAISKAKKLVGEITYEDRRSKLPSTPAIIFSTFTETRDLLILAYIFQEKEVTFISPQTLPDEPVIDLLRSTNQIIYLDETAPVGYRFYRRIMSVLRDFNRSVVISPDAAKHFASHLILDPAVLARIAMLANVPVLPVRVNWAVGQKRDQCNVWIGKKLFISPRTPEFKDIFFKTRGARKFSRLPHEEFSEIGRRIFSKIEERAS